MTRRRNNLDITVNILQIAKNGANKTHIVYRANLNFKLLDRYLYDLTKKGLLKKEDIGRKGIIETTEKGKKFLEYYQGFQQFHNLTYTIQTS